MSLILKQETASSAPQPAAGKTTIFVDSNNSLVLKSSTGATTVVPQIEAAGNTQLMFSDGVGLVGDANLTFDSVTGTLSTVNISTTTITANGSIGNGIVGGATTSGATKATGVSGQGYVSASADTGAAVGVRGYATDLHSGGYNIGVLGNAIGSGVGNYAFYVQNGGIASIENTAAWDLYDNSTTALVWQSTGKANILGLDTTNGAEGVYTAGYLSVTGNATAGNVSTAGLITATGNVRAGNLVTPGVISATGNANVGNIGAAAGVFTTIAGSLTTAAQPNITSVGTLTTASVSGNANVGNLGTAGLITATGNITGGNIITAGIMSSTGNATHGNVIATLHVGNLSGTGNSNVGNLGATGVFASTISATGNANVGNLGTAGQIISTVATGTAPFTVASTTKVINLNAEQVDGYHADINATASTIAVRDANANLSANNYSASGLITATGNVTGANFITGGLVTATGNIQGGNIITAGTMSSTGNATHGNVITGGIVSATGNVQAGNLVTTGTLSATGGATFAGNIAMTSKNITGLADPVNIQDAATKNYVDSVAQGLDVKPSVLVATTTTLATASAGTVTYNNGTSGVGATLTTTGSYTTIDGVSIATVGTRVLVKNESNAAWNGIYTYTSSTVLTRAVDFDVSTEMTAAFTFVEDGATQADTGWVCTSNGPITVGTTNIAFSQFSGAGTYAAGTGLTLTGTTFSVNASQTQVTSVGTLTSLSVSGNANIGNVGATAFITSATTINAGVTTTGNANVGNLGTGGLITATGNVSGGNITTAGQLVSSVATGTAPLTVTSTTRVANLNVAYANVADFTNVTTLSAGNAYLMMANALTGNVIEYANAIFVANTSNGALYATTFVGALSGAATTAGTVTTAAQPNITSVGTLTSLTVSSTISGSVSGSAATVTTAAQPNITSLGTLTSLTVGANGALTTTNLTTGANTTAGYITGNWTLTAGSKWNATYADLAEKYVADADYEPATVLVFGGTQEVTISTETNTTRVAGVVTTNAAFSMNNECQGDHVAEIALQGRVPCKVIGPIFKGDLLVSAGNGHAIANNEARAGTIIGKSLENFSGATGVIEVAVGRF